MDQRLVHTPSFHGLAFPIILRHIVEQADATDRLGLLCAHGVRPG